MGEIAPGGAVEPGPVLVVAFVVLPSLRRARVRGDVLAVILLCPVPLRSVEASDEVDLVEHGVELRFF